MNESKMFLIHKKYKEFTKSESKIADYILENPLNIIEMNIETLAEVCNTSISTISRFTKKLGLESFYYLKLEISKEFISPIKKNNGTREIITNNVSNLYSEIVRSNSEIILESIDSFNPETFEKVIDLIVSKNHIYLFGLGSSLPLVFEASDKLKRLGVKCSFSIDYHSQLSTASILNEEDLAIIFSHSGISKDILTITEIINSNGSETIGITNYSKTPFERSVDYCLSFSNIHNQDLRYNFSSRVPLILLIETIYEAVNIKFKNDKLIENYKRLFKERNV